MVISLRWLPIDLAAALAAAAIHPTAASAVNPAAAPTAVDSAAPVIDPGCPRMGIPLSSEQATTQNSPGDHGFRPFSQADKKGAAAVRISSFTGL